MATLLKMLLQERHLQTYELFRSEYRKAADRIGSDEEPPSRTQFRRWLSGDLRGLPHARHCRVLAAVFPDWSADELFAPAEARPREPQRTIPAHSHQPGQVVDVHTKIAVDISVGGEAVVKYGYEILNLTDRPIGRIPRTVWFKHTHDEITVDPVRFDERQVLIEMIHESEPQKKFAYHLSPAVEVGGRGRYGCEIRGGAFVDDLYWRHLAIRDTELMTMEITHQGHVLRRCSATEELTDGSEILVSDDIEWLQDGPDIRLRLQRADLKPTQVVTLRWEADKP
jgi:hypothetical protein